MDILDWLDTANEYRDLIKTGVAAASTYASYQDQKKKNRMQQQAYEDYMAQVNEAGKEARAAIDINYTPMTVSGVPTTKADVTDFTAVAAKGGLMSIPNRQRKRYARGPDEVDVMEFDEESITPFGLQQETGLDLTGEQVKYNTANPREGAWNVWNSGAINQEIYEFDFEIFFQSGDWMDMLKGQAPATGNMQMASADPLLQDEYDKYVFELQEIQPDATPMSIEDFRNQAVAGQANGGIIGLRHGGRARYESGTDWIVKKSDVEEEQVPRMGRAGQAAPEKFDWFQDLYLDREGGGGRDFMIPEKYIDILGGDERIDQMNIDAAEQETWERGEGNRLMNHAVAIIKKAMDEDPELGAQINEEFIAMAKDKNLDPGDAYYTIIKKYGDILEMKKGGRVKRDNGGIMNLGGLEKDYRTTGGFVPIGEYEKKDDVPARLSKNEFVFTADAVRAAGG